MQQDTPILHDTSLTAPLGNDVNPSTTTSSISVLLPPAAVALPEATRPLLFPAPTPSQSDEEETPPSPSEPSESQLTQFRLSKRKFPYVRYRPASSDGSDSDSEDSSDDLSDSPSTILPAARLPSYRAVCNICLVDFEPPQHSTTPEKLRRLPCSHVYHNECVLRLMDESADRGQFECPTCRRTASLRPSKKAAPAENALAPGDLLPPPVQPITPLPDHSIAAHPPPPIPFADDGNHQCRLRRTSTVKWGPRRPCFPGDRVVWLQNVPSTSTGLGDPSPATSPLCNICSQKLPTHTDQSSQFKPEAGTPLVLRQTPCGHIFHTGCLDGLLPICECDLPPGGVACPSCNAPLPLRSRDLHKPNSKTSQPSTRSLASLLGRYRSEGENLDRPWEHVLVADAGTSPSIGPPDTWYYDLVQDDRLLTLFRPGAHSPSTSGSNHLQRFLPSLRSIFSSSLQFEKHLTNLQKDGKIAFQSGMIRGPEGLWGHYIRIISVSDPRLNGTAINEVAWGVQWSKQEAKDVAALKLLQCLWDVEPLS